MALTVKTNQLGLTSQVPPGTPDWITFELTAETIETWQPYYDKLLTAEDAIDMIVSVSQLFEELRSENI